uniref:Putative heat shock hsp20 protein n=1 Tax=Ixodes ricinus TaxID=34613 RepID=A0A6B0V0M8_IXORI
MIVFPMAPIFTSMDRGAFPDCGSMMSRVFDGNDFDSAFFDGIGPLGLFGCPEGRRSSCKASSSKCPASEVSLTPDNFALKLDVRGFVPQKISVKTVGNSVEVHARHEEKDPEGRGFVMREFRRKYTLPDDVDPESVTSQLTGRGLLAVEAPRKKLETTPVSHTVPISVEHTSSSDVPSTSQGSS